MITWSHADGIYELELEHPPCNEIGSEVLERLESFVAEVAASSARVVIVYSALARGFCAGADLHELQRGLHERPEAGHEPALRAFIERVHAVMNTLDTLPVTTVAAIHGACFGGGLELALTCDVWVADRTARFCFPELRLGIIPGFGGIPRLKRFVGSGMVSDLLLTGRSINAKRAYELGLVSQLVGRGEALTVARRVAAQAALFEPAARAAAKSLIKSLPQAELVREKEAFLRLVLSPATRAALDRFVRSEDRMPYLPQGLGGHG